MGELAIITFPRSLVIAEKIQKFLGGEIIPYSKDAFKLAFEYDSIIAIMATGIAVRNIAPLIHDKWEDPAVVVIDCGMNLPYPYLAGTMGEMNWQKNWQALGWLL